MVIFRKIRMDLVKRKYWEPLILVIKVTKFIVFEIQYSKKFMIILYMKKSCDVIG